MVNRKVEIEVVGGLLNAVLRSNEWVASFRRGWRYLELRQAGMPAVPAKRLKGVWVGEWRSWVLLPRTMIGDQELENGPVGHGNSALITRENRAIFQRTIFRPFHGLLKRRGMRFPGFPLVTQGYNLTPASAG